MSEIRAGRFELPDHANVELKDGDVDLDDYYRKNPSASELVFADNTLHRDMYAYQLEESLAA